MVNIIIGWAITVLIVLVGLIFYFIKTKEIRLIGKVLGTIFIVTGLFITSKAYTFINNCVNHPEIIDTCLQTSIYHDWKTWVLGVLFLLAGIMIFFDVGIREIWFNIIRVGILIIFIPIINLIWKLINSDINFKQTFIRGSLLVLILFIIMFWIIEKRLEEHFLKKSKTFKRP